MSVEIQGVRWNERVILSEFPVYPSRVKAADIRARIRAKFGAVFHDQTWARWMKVLGQEGALIRLPGARFARPRSEDDAQHHVPPFTKRSDVAPRDRAQEIKAAVAVTRPSLKK